MMNNGNKRPCDGVFMGGGVRGIGHAGAAAAIMDAGYAFRRVAGASAGAIVAALIAAGYTSAELEEEMRQIDYQRFKGRDLFDLFPGGEILNLTINEGVYNADYFEEWMQDALERKGKATFADISRTQNDKYLSRLIVTAADRTGGRLLVLPQDLKLFGLDPLSYPVAKAVRMSMSIPLFYEPFRLIDFSGGEHLIADGGLICNYPAPLLDSGVSRLNAPVFGFKFLGKIGDPSDAKEGHTNVFEYIKLVFSCLLAAQYQQYAHLSRGDGARTIYIPTEVDGKNIGITDFSLSKSDADGMFENGRAAAKSFLKSWNFAAWLRRYR
jgi:NTE family protein